MLSLKFMGDSPAMLLSVQYVLHGGCCFNYVSHPSMMSGPVFDPQSHAVLPAISGC